MLGTRFDDAVAYAGKLHGDQTRKGSNGVPYMAHLLGVAALVLEDGGGEDEAIAGLLHDAAEDRGGDATLAEIRHRFGDAVADVVKGCSDAIPEPGAPKGDWWKRKCDHLGHLAAVRGERAAPILRVTMADKLSNLRATVRDAGLRGPGFWVVFRHGAASQLWYYGRMLDLFRARCPQSSMLPELELLLVQLDGIVPADDRALAARYRAEHGPQA
jgi:GTP pyrophosphokinase